MQENLKLPRNLRAGRDIRTQYGALCYRVVRGKAQVLLVTSRTTRRWIIPKGWPIRHTSPERAAKIEAWEEAGVRGKVEDRCIGYYSYVKLGHEKGEKDLPCVVCVYPVRVKSLAKDFPERKQRRRKWYSPRRASKKVAEPELRELLRNFNPAKIR